MKTTIRFTYKTSLDGDIKTHDVTLIGVQIQPHQVDDCVVQDLASFLADVAIPEWSSFSIEIVE